MKKQVPILRILTFKDAAGTDADLDVMGEFVELKSNGSAEEAGTTVTVGRTTVRCGDIKALTFLPENKSFSFDPGPSGADAAQLIRRYLYGAELVQLKDARS